jgi:hypothetical protein
VCPKRMQCRRSLPASGRRASQNAMAVRMRV